MPDETVQITLDVIARNQQVIDDVRQKTQGLSSDTDNLVKTVRRATEEHAKHESALLKIRHAVLALRKEFFAIGLAIAAVAATTKFAAASSDALTERFEKLGNAIKNFTANRILNPLGNTIAKFFGNTGEKSKGATLEILGLQAETAAARGDQLTALLKRQEAERIKLLQDATDERKRLIEKELLARQAAEREALRLQTLGLKTQIQNIQDFQKDIVQGLRGGVSDTLFNFLQGEHQSGQDVLKNFQTGINRAISEAFSQSLFSSLFGGGSFIDTFKNLLSGKNQTTQAVNNVVKEVQTSNKILEGARDCICRAAENTGVMAANSGKSWEATITPPKKSALDKIKAIADLTAIVAGAGAGAAGAGGGSTGGGSITMGGGGVEGIYHSGGFVRAFPSGGEVPITAQPGEFVVRKSVAMANREFLKEFNMQGGSQKSKSGQNVFFIKAVDAKSFDDMLATPAARDRIEIQSMRAVMANGGMRKIIRDFAR